MKMSATLSLAALLAVVCVHGSCLAGENNVNSGAGNILGALAGSAVPTAELRIYGHPTPFLERVMESVRAKGLHDVVHYLGLQRAEDIVDAIEECDLGIIPNQRNVFTEINTPVRIFEYLAMGKPVIAPRAVGIQDYFNDESLLFFELGNSDDLARKIEYVFFHPSDTIEIVKRGQGVYLAHTWCQERLSFVNLVGELLSSDGRPAKSHW